MNAAAGVPIRRRLIQIMLLASGMVLLVTTIALFARELLTYRDAGMQQLGTLSRVIAANSTAALAFENREDAESVLEALQADRDVLAAALYSEDGAVFATYPRELPAGALPAAPGIEQSYRTEGGTLIAFQPVIEGQQRMGMLFIRSDLRAARERLLLYAQMLVALVATSGVLAYFVSRRLQRRISGPILALADVATAVSRREDVTLHPEPTGIAEINQLTTAFDAMLSEMRQSDQRLRAQLGALSLLQRITHAIAMRQELNDVFDVVLRTTERDMPLDFACACLRDEASGELRVTAVGPQSRDAASALGMHVGEPLRGALDVQVAAGPLVHEPDASVAAVPLLQRLALAGLRSVVLSPLVVENQVIGLLIAARREPSSFSSSSCEFLRQLSEHVALAAHQAKLHGELKRAYEDLRQSQQTVLQQERLRALGQMASGIAHDINNAISPVSLYTEALLERETNLSPRAREYLTTIQRAIDDVAGTVARMREFYRHRETQLTLARVDVNRLVEQVLQLTEARWSSLPHERGIFIDLRKELAEGPLYILAAEGELRDALTNLIFNAVDAMPEGGVLTLRTCRLPGPNGAASRVTIEVADTGVGMDEETRRRCLEPFFTTKGERGTGLGLAMVYGAIQRHSAELHIDSAPGTGTTFRLGFDDGAAVPEPAWATQKAAVLTPRRRILLVDDDPVLVRSLCDILEADGHDVFAASGGQAGVDAFAEARRGSSPFDLVITDLGMPHVDGRRVAAAVKAMAPRTPVLMLTGWGQRMQADNDVPPHVDAVLSKPPRVAELRAAIAHVTERSA